MCVCGLFDFSCCFCFVRIDQRRWWLIDYYGKNKTSGLSSLLRLTGGRELVLSDGARADLVALDGVRDALAFEDVMQ